ncbi:MAG: LysR family transcriptional regulator [Clostridiales bacterium]|nr:LysR family transcriptional regulator [Clostridiales bacterium]
MQIEHLAEFVQLAQTGNYSEAAAQLFISQSSLSKHIMAMEKELGVPLFIRSTRSIRLSHAGELLLPGAIKISQMYEGCVGNLKRQLEKAPERIIIASTSHMVEYGITDAIAQFKREYYAIKLDVITERHDVLKSLLLKQKADFIWIGEPEGESSDPSMHHIPFLDESLVAMVNSASAHRYPNPMNVTELAQADIFMQDKSSVEQDLFIAFCRQNNFEPEITSVSGARMQILAVTANTGIAIMLRSLAESQRIAGTELIPIRNSPKVHVNLVYLKKESYPKRILQFLDFIKRWSETMQTSRENEGQEEADTHGVVTAPSGSGVATAAVKAK